MLKRLYFGHPINSYDTALEKELLRHISLSFRCWEIENPNQKHHQEEYTRWKEKTGNGMDYFLKRVLPNCQGGIFLPFRDNTWPSGVFMEAKFFAEREFPVWGITPNRAIARLDISTCLSLSREETISRVRTVSGKIIPY